MVYKRKAHVLFVGSGDSSRALMAAAFANSLGQRYMLARAVTLQARCQMQALEGIMREVGLADFDLSLHTLNSDNLVWADLLVTLDAAAAAACPVLPEHVQQRCYAFTPPENREDLREVRAAIQQRVVGMVGGMMLMDASADLNP